MGADLELVLGGRPVRFPAVWLRDNCPCPDCLAPGTGQKLKDITDIPNGLAITHTEDAGESVLVTFAPDRHQSAFPRSWLETDLRASLPLIQLSPSGRVRGVRFNNRSMRPLRRPYAEVTAFYAAYRRWAELLAQPGRQLTVRLAPGDCLVFDNTRVLHARTAFSMSPGSPGRHLQGCYADLDGLASTLAVLKREERS
jgi:alpha-ketoglutarate-dependent taurine dioxygenase